MGKICILGAGGHARVVLDILQSTGHAVDGVFDDARTDPLDGVPVLGPCAALLEHAGARVIVALGNATLRRRWAEDLERAGLELLTAIHPRAYVAASAQIGAGSVVCAGAVVGAGAQIGRHAIINMLAGVDHDCIVADNVHIAPGARLCGGARVGEDAMVGAGAVLVPGAVVPSGMQVPAGQVVQAG